MLFFVLCFVICIVCLKAVKRVDPRCSEPHTHKQGNFVRGWRC